MPHIERNVDFIGKETSSDITDEVSESQTKKLNEAYDKVFDFRFNGG